MCPSAFQVQLEAHRTPRMTRCFSSQLTLSPGNLISEKKVVKKKRQGFPKLPPAGPNSFTLPYVIHVLVGEYLPNSRSRYEAKPACAEHSSLLGSTNPCPTAVHVKPFYTSVFKTLILTFVTTTKIFTRSCFTQAHAKSFTANHHALLVIAGSCNNND